MNKSKHKAPSPPEIYIDEEGTLVVVGYEAYRKVSWVDTGRAIPAKWRKLEVVHNESEGVNYED